MWTLFGALACTSPSTSTSTETDPSTPEDTAPPEPATTCTATVEPNTDGAWLTAWLEVHTEPEATLEITIDDSEGTRTQTVHEVATDHRVLLLGLRPDTLHTLTAHCVGAADRGSSSPVELTTRPMPPTFPATTVAVAGSEALEPGLTVVPFTSGEGLAMFDRAGVPRWFLPPTAMVDPSAHSVSITPRDTLLVQHGKVQVAEYELSGRVTAWWRATAQRSDPVPEGAISLELNALHHDAFELPDGGLLLLSVLRELDPAYPGSTEDASAPTEPAIVASDELVEISRTGEVRYRVPLRALLDAERIGHGSRSLDYWYPFFEEPSRDWSHANSVWYDEDEDEVLVSLNNQDAVVGLDRARLLELQALVASGLTPLETGVVKWIFAPDKNWRQPWRQLLLRPADPDAVIPYHQHSASITRDGNLMLFDNGNHRASAYEPPLDAADNWSRAAEFTLDRENRTWTLAWAFAGDPTLYASAFGGCQELPATGHRLVTFGRVETGDIGALVAEVQGGPEAQLLWYLRWERPVWVYRAAHVSGLVAGF